MSRAFPIGTTAMDIHRITFDKANADMAAITESSTSAEEHDIQKQKSVDPVGASELTAEQNGGVPIGLLSVVGQPV